MVGLITCHEVYNYGSRLMSYAMQRKLDELGCRCENIQYIPKKDFHYFLSLPFKCVNGHLWRDKIRVKEEERIRTEKKSGKIDYEKKITAFDDFVVKYMRLSKPYIGFHALKKSVAQYDGFVLGSDQVWAPMNLEGDFKNMVFVPANLPKITYGASFGVTRIPDNQKMRTKRYLKRIQYISVREEQGAAIVQNLIGRQVPVVLDPTLLFSSEEWDEISNIRLVPKVPYIFVYFLGKKEECRQEVVKLKHELRLKVIAIDAYPSDSMSYADEFVNQAGPDDFVGLIKNASFVCTDSFHGTAFSILYERPFITFFRDEKGASNSANSRVENLLRKLKLEKRLNDGGDILKMEKEIIDFTVVHKKLEQLKGESESYLKYALKEEGLL